MFGISLIKVHFALPTYQVAPTTRMTTTMAVVTMQEYQQ